MVPEVDVVYPLHGGLANEGKLTSEYQAGKPPINQPLERHSESDGAGISLVVRIRGTMIALAGRFCGQRLRVLIDSGSTGNYLSAQSQTVLELKVKPEDDLRG